MSNEYEEERDRNLAVAPDSDYVLTATNAVQKETAKSHTQKGLCEYVLGVDGSSRYTCHNKARYWVQRGPVNRMSCHQHLPRTVSEFWQIKPGRYGVSEHYEGYWISAVSSVVVKMQATPEGLWR